MAVIDAWVAGERDDESLLRGLTQMPADTVSHLMLLVNDRDGERWLRIGQQLAARTPAMGRGGAILSLRDDILDGRP